MLKIPAFAKRQNVSGNLSRTHLKNETTILLHISNNSDFLFNSKKLIKSEPKISILGSVHFPTENLNADSIYNVLLDFKPDLILTEIDEDKMYKDFTYKNLYNENEIISIKESILKLGQTLR